MINTTIITTFDTITILDNQNKHNTFYGFISVDYYKCTPNMPLWYEIYNWQ
jgi:hypothetical protein